MKLRDGQSGTVVAVSSSPTHMMSKPNRNSVTLIAGQGVEGDAHAGPTVKHRSRVARDPSQPNLRQVHLIHAELHQELGTKGFHVLPGQMGENVTTQGIDLLGLPEGAKLTLGHSAVVQITGLRNPCGQLNGIQPGLMDAVLDHDDQGNTVRKAGVMAVVLQDGEVLPGDTVQVELPPPPHSSLQPV